jgi:hypothetical protein
VRIAVDGSSCPSVLDAGLPIVDDEQAPRPDETHHIIRQAYEQASIAIGSHGPKPLSYGLVRDASVDRTFWSTPIRWPRPVTHCRPTLVGANPDRE